MMSLREIKESLKRPDLSDAEAEKIRDVLYGLADICLEKFLEETRHLYRESGKK